MGCSKTKEVAGTGGKLYEVLDLVEKPKLADAPSNLAVIGRYILTPTIFETLSDIKPGAGGELQLTDGLRGCCSAKRFTPMSTKARRHDTGDKLGFLKATVEFALKREDLGGRFSGLSEKFEVVSEVFGCSDPKSVDRDAFLRASVR